MGFLEKNPKSVGALGFLARFWGLRGFGQKPRAPTLFGFSGFSAKKRRGSGVFGLGAKNPGGLRGFWPPWSPGVLGSGFLGAHSGVPGFSGFLADWRHFSAKKCRQSGFSGFLARSGKIARTSPGFLAKNPKNRAARGFWGFWPKSTGGRLVFYQPTPRTFFRPKAEKGPKARLTPQKRKIAFLVPKNRRFFARSRRMSTPVYAFYAKSVKKRKSAKSCAEQRPFLHLQKGAKITFAPYAFWPKMPKSVKTQKRPKMAPKKGHFWPKNRHPKGQNSLLLTAGQK